MPKTQLICVMDREADFFDLFNQQRQAAQPANLHLLVRAKHDWRIVLPSQTNGRTMRLTATRGSRRRTSCLEPCTTARRNGLTYSSYVMTYSVSRQASPAFNAL